MSQMLGFRMGHPDGSVDWTYDQRQTDQWLTASRRDTGSGLDKRILGRVVGVAASSHVLVDHRHSLHFA
jgi:hypothetical protein